MLDACVSKSSSNPLKTLYSHQETFEVLGILILFTQVRNLITRTLIRKHMHLFRIGGVVSQAQCISSHFPQAFGLSD